MKRIIKNIILALVSITFLALVFYNTADANQQKDSEDLAKNDSEFVVDPEEFPFAEENENCMICHGEQYFTLTEPITGIEKKRIMAANYIFSREEYYESNHKSFACLDCHAYEFEEFPHPVAARLEEPYACMDCHGYDDDYAEYQFEKIDEEYNKSVHAAVDGFSCWKCHDAHTYKLNIRNSADLKQTIVYNNNICLNCHGNEVNFMLLTDKETVDIVAKHEWLPNQAAHFANVRCIECHTAISDSILVAHEVRPVEDAVRKCTECHSSDSRLMSSLYKFQSKESRKNGFVNAVILNESYVIGANRNIYLNIGSIVIFGLVLLTISVHVIFRIIKK
jgi:predicted CXXCH cytochrome family protein